MDHVVGEIYSKVGFGGHFGHKTSQFSHLVLFSWKNLWEDLRIPFYDWIVPELQSGELRIQQHLKPKIKPAKLTTKCIWLTYEP